MTWSNLTILFGTLAVVAVGLHLLPRHPLHKARSPGNEVAAAVFAMVGVLYAVLLAFVVIVVWEAADEARATTFREADQLAGLYWNARQFPTTEGAELTTLTLRYAHSVIDDEWPVMKDGHASAPRTTELVYRIRDTTNALGPAGPVQQVQFEHAVAHVEGLATERRARLNQIENAVPPLLWAPLILGAVLSIAFTFLFSVSSLRLHTAMVLIMTAMICVSLIVVKELNYPFDGLSAVRPDAFEIFLARLPTTH
ncbi:DUF4239 domain-containing protein [Kitasatospora purpeofusca]|uniref:bestrophin-like domain n=1 Tax=Kitasatospora purpeofusca TaxID=67352 RepID=UPI002A59A63E|nr:DUF4239 domain-containing protein [Kitasatospora purpeofusca]MDY0810322.1 DUF4239 domain-containing protein [Kitasatospora purpeofusca]